MGTPGGFRRSWLSAILGAIAALQLDPSFALAMGKRPHSDPVVQIPESHRNYLKVLSLNFNSEDVLADSSGNLREQRFAALVDWVQKNDVDIVMIQEGWNFRDHASVAIDLARVLNYDVHFRIGMGGPGLFYDSNILLAKKQYQMSELQEFKLAHSAPDFGDGKTWTVPLGRVTYAIGAKLTLSSGEPLYLYTTHLIGADAREKEDQIADLRSRIDALLSSDGTDPSTAKIILSGDMNFDPVSKAAASLRAAGFADTFDQAHPGDGSCSDCADPALPYFNPITIGSGLFPDQSDEASSERTDFIFSRGLATLASTLEFSVPFESVWMSDHYGVLSILGTGGSVSDLIPNPSHDSEPDPFSPTVLHANDRLFDCGSYWCDPELPSIQVRGPRGLVVVNQFVRNLKIRLQGPGNILTKPDAELAPDRSVGFSFETSGKYRIELETPDGDLRTATVEVNL